MILREKCRVGHPLQPSLHEYTREPKFNILFLNLEYLIDYHVKFDSNFPIKYFYMSSQQ